MEQFIRFLSDSKNIASNIEENKSTSTIIHVVLGNESTDLDSTTCTLLLSYYLRKIVYADAQNTTFVIPVLNLQSEEFPLRTEVCKVLTDLGIQSETLVFRNQIDLGKLQQKIQLQISLVDHHVLAARDAFLKNNVVQIHDHRPVDKSLSTFNSTVDCVIKEIGSCSTLIAEEILKANESLLCKETATLLYYTIIYDTIYLLPEHGKAKELDKQVAEKLEKMFNFNADDRKLIFDELWKAHTNVTHLTPNQLLLRDFKIVNSVPIPGLPMLVEEFLRLPKAIEAVESFRREKTAEVVVIMGLKAADSVKRDIALYCENKNSTLLQLILKKLQNADLGLCEIDLNISGVMCFQQNNIKASRKQIVPLIKEATVEGDKLIN